MLTGRKPQPFSEVEPPEAFLGGDERAEDNVDLTGSDVDPAQLPEWHRERVRQAYFASENDHQPLTRELAVSRGWIRPYD